MRRFLLSAFLAFNLVAVSYALTPEDFAKHREKKQEAVRQFNAGNHDTALELIGQVLSANPNDRAAQRYLEVIKRLKVEPYCKRAVDSLNSGRTGEAVEYWERILKLNPGDERVVTLLNEFSNAIYERKASADYSVVHRLLAEKRYEPAITEIGKILTSFPDDEYAKKLLESTRRELMDGKLRVYFDQADKYISEKQFDLALTELDKAVEVDDKQSSIVEGRKEAIKKMRFEHVIEGYYQAADAYAESGQFDLAKAELKKALSMDENQKSVVESRIEYMKRMETDSMYDEAEALFRGGDYTGSKKQFLKIMEINPEDADVKKTIEKLDDAIKIIPVITREGAAWLALKKALSNYISKSGDPKLAFAAVWYAVQLDPGNAAAVASRALIEQKYAGFMRSLEPPTTGMNIVEQYLFAALNHIYQGRYDMAVDYCNIVLELQPDSILAMKRLGSAYYAMGRKEEALQTWKKALEISPEDKELQKFIKDTR